MFYYNFKRVEEVTPIKEKVLASNKKIEEVKEDSQLVRGDLSNIPWQKHIYQLEIAFNNGDLYGDEREQARVELLEYFSLCKENKSTPYPFIDAEHVEKLRHLFQGKEHYKAHIDQDEDDELDSKSSRWVFKDDNFYGFANRIFYHYITGIEDSFDNWEQTRQQFAENMFGFDHSVSDKGLYNYLCQNFEEAIKISPQAIESKFSQVILPHGVSVKIPKTWWLIGGDLNAALETFSETMIDLSGLDIPNFKETTLIRANSMPRTTYASISVTASDAEFKAEELRVLTKEELRIAGLEMRKMMNTLLKQGGDKIESFDPLTVVELDNVYGLDLNYQRSGPKGSVVVKATRYIVGDKEINITTSYRKKESTIWKPIILTIHNSININKKRDNKIE